MQRIDITAAQDYYNIGIAQYNLKNYDDAILSYNEALALYPAFAVAYNGRGCAFYRLRKLQEAMSDYNQSLMLEPKDAKVYNNRGFLYHHLKEFDKAISDYNQALVIDSQLIYVYYNRGITFSAQGKMAQALSDFIHLVRINQSFESLFTTLANQRPTLYKRLNVVLKKINKNASIMCATIKDLHDIEQMELLALCLNMNNPVGNIFCNNESFLKNMAAHLLELDNKYFIQELKKIANVDNKISLLRTCLNRHSFLGKKFIKEYNKNSTILTEMIEMLRNLDVNSYTTFNCVTSSGTITDICFFNKLKPKPIQGKSNVVEEVEDYKSLLNNL